MYPITRSNNQTHIRNTDIEQRRKEKREQLAELLISKFRNKHNVNVAEEREIDTLIQIQVSRFVMPAH